MALGRRSRGGNAGTSSRVRVGAAAVALAGIVAASVTGGTDPVDAQDPFVPAEIVSFEPNGALLRSNAFDLAISALGNVVSWEYENDGPVSLMRVRTDNATVQPVPRTSEYHGLSDDGCVIAYQGSQFLQGEFLANSVYRFNRCTGGSTSLGFNYGRWIIGRAALDADGSVVAFPVVNGVDLYVLSGDNLSSQRTIPPPAQGWSVSDIAISDNGATAAVITGPDSNNDGFLDSSSLYILDIGSGTYQGIATQASSVSMSGDGTLVSFRNYELGQLFVLDRSAGQVRPIGPFNGAEISRDGRYLALRLSPTDSSFVFVARSDDRWASIAASELASYPLPNATGFVTASNGVISEHGRWVGWISPFPYRFVDQPREVGQYDQRQALVRERRPVVTVQPVDFGTVAGPTDRESVITNVGPSGWRITAVEASGPFQVLWEDCPDVLHPGQSCPVGVRFLAQASGQSVGELIVRDNSYPGIPLVASGRLVGSFDPGTPPPRATTTTTTTSVPGSGVVTTTTEPGTPQSVGLSITPSPIVFDNSVVGQAAPTRDATVTNVGDIAVTVQSIGIAGVATADFDVIDDGCTDEALAPGASCTLEIRFSPTAGGTRSAAVSASGTSGTFAAAPLRGSGRYDVELELSPEVAGGGQVVTVTGTGYPASTAVQVSLAGSTPQPASTDAAGRFVVQWLVLEGTPQGVVQADDVATSDYDAEPVDLQIVPSPMRPQGNLATLDRLARNHVSR